MSLTSYIATIEEWKRLYTDGNSRLRRYNLTELNASCVKCGKLKKKMSRHHKGNDFFFAKIYPHLYAKRYLEFRPEDCAKLCDNCHVGVHKFYAPLFEQMMNSYHERDSIVTPEWCDIWRDRFRDRFNMWLTLKPRKRRKRRKSRSSTK